MDGWVGAWMCGWVDGVGLWIAIQEKSFQHLHVIALAYHYDIMCNHNLHVQSGPLFTVGTEMCQSYV